MLHANMGMGLGTRPTKSLGHWNLHDHHYHTIDILQIIILFLTRFVGVYCQSSTVELGQCVLMATPLCKLDVLEPQLQVTFELSQGTLHIRYNSHHNTTIALNSVYLP